MRRILAVVFGVVSGMAAISAIFSPLDPATSRFDLGPVTSFAPDATHEVALALQPTTQRTDDGYPEFNRVFVVASGAGTFLVLPGVSPDGCRIVWRSGRGALAGFRETCDDAAWDRSGVPRDAGARPLPRITAELDDRRHVVIDTSRMDASGTAMSLRLPQATEPAPDARLTATPEPEWRLVVAPATATGIPQHELRTASILVALSTAMIALTLYINLAIEARARRRRDTIPVILHGKLPPD